MLAPNFRHEINGEKLIMAIAQDYKTNKILMAAYMNEEAYEKSIKTKKAHYYSTSRKQLWLKGETSGHIQKIKEILVDCDMDAIILKIDQKVGACHTGYETCFYRRITNENELEIIEEKVYEPKDVY
ncbi:MAG: phosphoribosyl-AMP cyclohydrolase [Methanobacteriaceae archaeon]|nr:phosphoribosyl-AMP cyclohydrolase [Methanobacteriaceae archaeon]